MSTTVEHAWREYVTGELQRFYQHCDGVTYIWQHTAQADALVVKLGGDSEAAAFRGPWHVIRKHLQAEFRQWVEEYEGTERLTPSAWAARAKDEREHAAYADSAEHTLGQLIELRRLTLERDSLILEAAQRGASKVSIAAAVGLSRQQVHAIITAHDTAAFEDMFEDSEVF